MKSSKKLVSKNPPQSPKKPAKRSAFWDEDDEPTTPEPESSEPIGMKINRALASSKPSAPVEPETPAKRTPPPPPPRKIEPPKELVQLTTPPDFHNVRCGEDRVVIMASLGADHKDLLCFHIRLGCTMHLKREDLTPKEVVDRAVTFVLETRK